MRISVAILLLLGAANAGAEAGSFEWGGHAKLRSVGQTYPDNSVFREAAGSGSIDTIGELRLNLANGFGRWSLHADYQFLAVNSEFLPFGLPDDSSRGFDATKIIDSGGDTAILHRLDRLWLGYTGDRTTLRVGRQALSWGNGLFFHPMDLVNPFAATAIDTEYKTGDDMVYAQYLLEGGNDLQGAVVFRRNPVSGRIESEQGTGALKYHGFAGESEFDILIAEDHDNTVVGIGGARSVGGAVWRGDVVVTDAPDDTLVQVVTNLSYSWTWRERNVSGTGEYYFDGEDGHYLGGSLMIEMSPLWTLSPTLVSRVDDPSALFQLVTRYSLSDNKTFLGSLNIPLGADGTGFGGAESPVPNRYLSFDAGVFLQLAWYF